MLPHLLAHNLINIIFGIQWPFDFWFLHLFPDFSLTGFLVIFQYNLRSVPPFFLKKKHYLWTILGMHFPIDPVTSYKLKALFKF